jgi:hypothetical protein
MSEDAKSLEAVIEAAMDPIQEGFEKALRLVHEHGALEEREAVVRWLRERGAEVGPCSRMADQLAGEYRNP